MTTNPAGILLKIVVSTCVCWMACLSCNNIDPLPPAPTEELPALELSESQFHLPVVYDVKDFEGWINEKITGTFVEQGIKIGNDSVFVKIKKLSAIKLSLKDDRLIIDLPLHVRGTYFTRFMGKRVRNLTPIKTEVLIRFSSKVNLESNWHLHTQTSLVNLTWISEPVVHIFGIKFNLKEPLEKVIDENQHMLIAKLDEIAYESIHLDKPLTNIWLKLQEPKMLGTPKAGLWLKFNLKDVYVENIILDNSGKINVNMFVSGRARMSTNRESLPQSNPTLPDFLPMKKSKEAFDISILASIPYHDLNKMLNEKLVLAGFGKFGNRIRIRNVSVSGTGEQMNVAADLRGMLKGKVYLVGNPSYHADSKHLKVSNFQFDVNTQNALLGLADSWAHDQLRDSIAQQLNVDLSHLINQLPSLISEVIEKGKAAKSIDLNFDTFDIKSCDVVFMANEMQVLVRTQGKAQLELQKLKVKKRLRVR